jgi:SAM-dependent methyltransferase
VERQDDAFHCTAATCDYARRLRFPSFGGHPALIDFERSIVREEDLARRAGKSQVRRVGSTRGARRGFQWLTTPYNAVAERQAARLVAELSARERPRLLVIGGGTIGNGAEPLYAAERLDIIAFDLWASPWTQFIADAHAVPLADHSVDAVWVQAVLEHVLDPWKVVTEITRVLKDDGLVYAETPFLQQVHEGPYDFTRFTESGHRWLFKRFERLDSGVVAGCGNQLSWTIDHVVRSLTRSVRIGRLARILTFWVQGFDRVIPERFAIDGASTVFFFGRKAEREIPPSEMVRHYRGAQRRGQ